MHRRILLVFSPIFQGTPFLAKNSSKNVFEHHSVPKNMLINRFYHVSTFKKLFSETSIFHHFTKNSIKISKNAILQSFDRSTCKITFAIDSWVNFTPIYDLTRNFTSVFLKFYTLITTNHTSKNSIFVFRKVKNPQKSFEIAQNHITRGKNRWRIDWRGYFGMIINEKIQKLSIF